MIRFKTKALGFLPVRMIWFAPKPQKKLSLYSFYKQSACCENLPGYIRKPFFTKVIDLTAPLTEIEKGIEKQTIYEYNRGMKEGVTTMLEPDLSQFVIFYNLFAQQKKLPPLGRGFFKYVKNIIITKATLDESDLVMHAYILDEEASRVRLLYSATSGNYTIKGYSRALQGRANRLLHYKDICLFKTQGFKCYDLGGYAMHTSDTALLGINKFKDSFGGSILEESDYLPLPLKLFATLSALF
jgi:hypothetical protein